MNLAPKTQIYHQPKKELGIDLAQDISDHATELLWGQGHLSKYEGTQKANDRMQELMKYNRAEEFFPDLEKKLSLFGNMYATIDVVDGKPTWTLCDPYLNSMVNGTPVPAVNGTIYGMGRAFVTDVVAVIWKRITMGTISFPIKEIWTQNKVERIFFGENNKKVTLAHVNKELPKEMQLTEVWEHNMGFVPVMWFKNVPTFGGASYPDGYKGAAPQAIINKTLCELWHETETNRTRIIGNLDESTYQQLMRGGAENQLNKSDYLINVKTKNSEGQNDTALVPIVADPKFEQYWLSINAAKDEYYKLAGYSPLGDGNTEKTATENLLMKTGDYQTTKKKRNQRTQEINQLIAMTLKIDAAWGYGDIYGKDIDNSITFQIMENKVMDSLQEISNLQTMIDNDFMSKVEAIAQLRGITIDEARDVFKQIIADKSMEIDSLLSIGLTPEGMKDDSEDSEDKDGGE